MDTGAIIAASRRKNPSFFPPRLRALVGVGRGIDYDLCMKRIFAEKSRNFDCFTTA
jgi:hypothetical protein